MFVLCEGPGCRCLQIIGDIRSHWRGRCSALIGRCCSGRGSGGIVQVNIGGRLGIFPLGLEKARLETNNVVAQLVILLLDGFVAIIQGVVLADLRFQAFDVALFSLSERSL